MTAPVSWIVFTNAQCVSALGSNSSTIYQVIPRRIDNPAHPLHGQCVAPARVAEGDYAEFWADRLAGHDRIEADPGDLFLPPIEDGV